MEEDDDDLYDPTNAVSSGTKQVSPTQDSEQQKGDVGMAEGDDYEEEEEEEEDEVCAPVSPFDTCSIC